MTRRDHFRTTVRRMAGAPRRRSDRMRRVAAGGFEMKLPRRNFLHLAAGAAALPAGSCFAWAQAYPTRPVRLIVGFPAGGVADLFAPDWPMAVGAPWSTIHHREPAGRRRQP